MAGSAAGGKIITFYSYKGGTGRSMALANVAWILASNGKRVLTLDWDMEAPGLHRYFYPFLVDRDLTSSDGIIDFVIKFATAATIPHTATAGGRPAADEDDWYKPYANILRYATSLNWRFENGGSLDFIPSGRQGSSYGTRVNSFNWKKFYEELGGGALLEAAKEKMRAEYDYILVDSRTGVSDTSGICTVQMPDILVICFTLNNQSVEGASNVATSIFEQRALPDSRLDRTGAQAHPNGTNDGIQIFPVPTRIENAEKVKLQTRKDYARDKFKLFPNSLPGEVREQYWGDVPVIYVPYYAYEEILAPFGDNSADRISILAAAEQLTSYLTRGEVTKLVPITDSDRHRVLAQYESGIIAEDPAEKENKFAEYVLSRLPEDEKELVRRVLTRLVRVAGSGEVGGDTLLRINVADIKSPDSKVLRPLIDSSLIRKDYDYQTKQERVSVAQSSLLRNWQRLWRWIDTDRDFLLWRQRLGAKIDEWEKSERDAGALLSGPSLMEAQEWLNTREGDLNAVEAAYITKSVGEAQRSQREQEKDKRRRQRVRRYVYFMTIISLLVLVAAYTALHPLETKFDIEPHDLQQDGWIISQNRRVAISFTSNKPSTLFRTDLGNPWDTRSEIEIPFVNMIISPQANYILGVTQDNKVYVWRLEEKLTSESKPVLNFSFPPQKEDDRSTFFSVSRAGFSPDERWVYLITPDNRLYLWQPGEVLGDDPPPYLKLVTRSSRDYITVTISPKGKYIALTGDFPMPTADGLKPKREKVNPSNYPNDSTDLLIYQLDQAKNKQPLFRLRVMTDFEPRISFSSNDEWLGYTRPDANLYIQRLSQSAMVNDSPALDIGSAFISDSGFSVGFSPNSEWVVAKRTFSPLYAWKVNQPPGKQAKPVVDTGKQSFESGGDIIRFSPDSRWVVAKGADQALYMWELGKSYDKLLPLFPRIRASRDRPAAVQFSPKGDFVAVQDSEGRLLVWKPGDAPDIKRPAAFLDSAGVKFDWGVDANNHTFIFVSGGSEVFFGAADGPRLDPVARENLRIDRIAETPDHRDLIIFSTDKLQLIRKKKYFWNISIKTYPWPNLETDESSNNQDSE